MPFKPGRRTECTESIEIDEEEIGAFPEVRRDRHQVGRAFERRVELGQQALEAKVRHGFAADPQDSQAAVVVLIFGSPVAAALHRKPAHGLSIGAVPTALEVTPKQSSKRSLAWLYQLPRLLGRPPPIRRFL